jgi:hypothetical protein
MCATWVTWGGHDLLVYGTAGGILVVLWRKGIKEPLEELALKTCSTEVKSEVLSVACDNLSSKDLIIVTGYLNGAIVFWSMDTNGKLHHDGEQYFSGAVPKSTASMPGRKTLCIFGMENRKM